jgi:sugar phosphate isomerase/epimerase
LAADEAKRKEAYDHTKLWIDGAEALGASHMRIFGGPVPKGMTQAQALHMVVEAMKSLCDYAGSKGITLGIETHSGITQKADITLEIMHRLNHPYAGVTLDISHFKADSNEDKYKQIEACVPYATMAHIRPIFDDKSPIDLDRVWQMLAKANHRGYLSVEYEGGGTGEDPMPGVRPLVEQMKSLCKKYSAPPV